MTNACIKLLELLRWAHQADPSDEELFAKIKDEADRLKNGELKDSPSLWPHIDDALDVAIAARGLPESEASADGKHKPKKSKAKSAS